MTLRQAILDLLTDEDKERGYICVAHDVGLTTAVQIGDNMVEKIKELSPFRDHIVGFKRNNYEFDLVLDKEGQRLWDKKYREIGW